MCMCLFENVCTYPTFSIFWCDAKSDLSIDRCPILRSISDADTILVSELNLCNVLTPNYGKYQQIWLLMFYVQCKICVESLNAYAQQKISQIQSSTDPALQVQSQYSLSDLLFRQNLICKNDKGVDVQYKYAEPYECVVVIINTLWLCFKVEAYIS